MSVIRCSREAYNIIEGESARTGVPMAHALDTLLFGLRNGALIKDDEDESEGIAEGNSVIVEDVCQEKRFFPLQFFE